MSRNTVLLFPGQGAYVPGVLTTLSRDLPELRLTFEEVDAVAVEAGLASVSDAVAAAPRLDQLLRDEPAHILQLTLYASAVGMHRLLVAHGMRPVTMAGHSLGEIAALVCGGAFSFREGAKIVLHRTAVVEGLKPGGAMLAVGQTPERVQWLLDFVGDPDAVIAVENDRARPWCPAPTKRLRQSRQPPRRFTPRSCGSDRRSLSTARCSRRLLVSWRASSAICSSGLSQRRSTHQSWAVTTPTRTG